MTPHRIDTNSRLYRYVRRFTKWKPYSYGAQGEHIPADICSFRRALIGQLLAHLFCLTVVAAIYAMAGIIMAKGVIDEYGFSMGWAVVVGIFGPPSGLIVVFACAALAIFLTHIAHLGAGWVKRKLSVAPQSTEPTSTIAIMWSAFKNKYCVPIELHTSTQPEEGEQDGK